MTDDPSVIEFMGSTSTASGVLTLEDLEAAVAAIERVPEPHQHVVHPLSVGWSMCASCLSPVYIKTPKWLGPLLAGQGMGL